MKSPQHISAMGAITTSKEVVQWAHHLTQLHARLTPYVARPEPRRRILSYLQGILSHTPRKNGWQIAEHAREATPYGMQRLLSHAVWDANGVRDEVRAYVLEHLGLVDAVVVIDETSFLKRGAKSAGVGRQYCGTTGQVENCQVGVFLAYVTAHGHSLIDRELYLPLDWCEDQQRCRAAGIPTSTRFHTKPELAVQMLARLQHAQLPIGWVVADTVYGSNPELRTWCERQHYSYVLAIPCNEPVGILTPDGRRRRVEVAQVEECLLSAQDWQRISMNQGTKGPRFFDWALVPILSGWHDDGTHWLLLRRCLQEPMKRTFYLVFAPAGTTLQQMVHAIGARWEIEVDFENSKDLGLDHYEVRSFIGWYRHITLVMLAYAFLTGICTHHPAAASLSCSPLLPTAVARAAPVRPLLALTVPDVRHLLGCLIWPAACNVKLVLSWSRFRRHHQIRASYFHTRRRLLLAQRC